MFGKQEKQEGTVVAFTPYDIVAEVNAQYPEAPEVEDEGPELEEPETDGGESMEYAYDEAEDSAPATTTQTIAKPKAKRRQGVSRMLVEAVNSNPGLTQSEYQRALGIKSPIATMAKRLVERGILVAKQDGRYVRYYPGKMEFSEVATGRKPKTVNAKTRKPQPETKAEKSQPKGWDIVSIRHDNGNTEQFVRLDGHWFRLVAVENPLG